MTDERGRRRFHGAFTGGFSAGYFNTAGSRHGCHYFNFKNQKIGWVPQTFKSTRTERGERFEQMAEDFMDEEVIFNLLIILLKLFLRTLANLELLRESFEQNLILWTHWLHPAKSVYWHGKEPERRLIILLGMKEVWQIS